MHTDPSSAFDVRLLLTVHLPSPLEVLFFDELNRCVWIQAFLWQQQLLPSLGAEWRYTVCVCVCVRMRVFSIDRAASTYRDSTHSVSACLFVLGYLTHDVRAMRDKLPKHAKCVELRDQVKVPMHTYPSRGLVCKSYGQLSHYNTSRTT